MFRALVVSCVKWSPRAGLAAVMGLVCALLPTGALADSAHPDPYEIQLYKLGNPTAGDATMNAVAHDAFRSFVRQVAAAMTSVNLAPPSTLGHSGFAVTAELSVITLNNGALPTVQDFKGPLLIPSVHFRKGLPASFELGGRAAWFERSRMGIGTLELKWALNEGFAYLPDIAVRGNISKLINSRDFDVTAGGLDLGVGKRFAIAGMVTLTPYAGWNLVFVGATSGTVDFTPSRTLTQSDDAGGQYANFGVFEAVQAAANAHNRFYAGFRFVGGVFQLGFEVSYSVIGRFKGEKSAAATDVPAVLALNSCIGLDF